MLQALERDGQATGLYVFPTKALAQDQKRALGNLLAATEGMEDMRVSLRFRCSTFLRLFGT